VPSKAANNIIAKSQPTSFMLIEINASRSYSAITKRLSSIWMCS
jgi:hypothetical protein